MLREKTRMASASDFHFAVDEIALGGAGQARLPRLAGGLRQPLVGRPAFLGDVERRHDAGHSRMAELFVVRQVEIDLEDAFLLLVQERSARCEGMLAIGSSNSK